MQLLITVVTPVLGVLAALACERLTSPYRRQIQLSVGLIAAAVSGYQLWILLSGTAIGSALAPLLALGEGWAMWKCFRLCSSTPS